MLAKAKAYVDDTGSLNVVTNVYQSHNGTLYQVVGTIVPPNDGRGQYAVVRGLERPLDYEQLPNPSERYVVAKFSKFDPGFDPPYSGPPEVIRTQPMWANANKDARPVVVVLPGPRGLELSICPWLRCCAPVASSREGLRAAHVEWCAYRDISAHDLAAVVSAHEALTALGESI